MNVCMVNIGKCQIGTCPFTLTFSIEWKGVIYFAAVRGRYFGTGLSSRYGIREYRIDVRFNNRSIIVNNDNGGLIGLLLCNY